MVQPVEDDVLIPLVEVRRGDDKFTIDIIAVLYDIELYCRL